MRIGIPIALLSLLLNRLPPVPRVAGWLLLTQHKVGFTEVDRFARLLRLNGLTLMLFVWGLWHRVLLC